MEKTEVVAKIIEYVGGKDNVVNTWHCMTRLRFELKDTSKIQEDAIKALDGVIGVQFAKGQLQIVLGTSVHKYYDIALQMLDLKEDIAAPAQPEKKKDFISWFMDMVSGVFGPIVPAIAGAGMIKGLMGGLVALGVVSNATDTYKIIDMLASGVFTFLPFFIAASAAKKFKTNQYLAIAIAATLMYPTMVDAAKAGEISNFMFAGILPIPVFNYSGSVIPIIFGVFALSYIYKWVDNIVPEAAQYLSPRNIVEIARSTVFNCKPDALCVSGLTAGEATDTLVLKQVKDAVPDTVVLCNTGCKLENIETQLTYADGAVVATTFKVDGRFENPVDGKRVKEFMDKVRSFRAQ